MKSREKSREERERKREREGAGDGERSELRQIHGRGGVRGRVGIPRHGGSGAPLQRSCNESESRWRCALRPQSQQSQKPQYDDVLMLRVTTLAESMHRMNCLAG